MTEMPPAPGEWSYRLTNDIQWTDKAFESLQEGGDMHGEVISRGGVVASRVWGPCPRCRHVLDDRQTLSGLPGLTGVGGPRGDEVSRGETAQAWKGRYAQVDVSCGCGDTHDGAPEGRTGCGVSFRVELPVQEVSHSGQ